MTVTIDTDAVINSILLTEQGSPPTTPGAGLDKLYVTTNGLYLLNSAGALIGPYITGTAGGLSVGRVLISEQTPTGTGTVTWSSIPATYKSLEIEYVARSTKAASTNTDINLYFNNDTTAGNYRSTRVYGYAASTSLVVGTDTAVFASVPAASSDAGACGAGWIKIINYAGTTFRKQVLGAISYRENASVVAQVTMTSTMDWESTVAINRVDLILATDNYDTGSTFRLYGVY